MAESLIDRAWRETSADEIESDLAGLWREVAQQQTVARAVMSNLVVVRTGARKYLSDRERVPADLSLDEVVARLEAVIDARVDAAVAAANDSYTYWMRFLATGVAILGSILVSAWTGLLSLPAAALVGVLAVPVAPIAKDLVGFVELRSKTSLPPGVYSANLGPEGRGCNYAVRLRITGNTAVGKVVYSEENKKGGPFTLRPRLKTTAGAVIVERSVPATAMLEVNRTSGDADPARLTPDGTQTFFRATDGTSGVEPWRFDRRGAHG